MKSINKILRLNHLNKIFFALLSTALGGLFVFSGYQKIIDPVAFSDSVANFRILPTFLVNIFAIILSWLEFLLGIFLLMNINRKENLFLILILMLGFTLAIITAILRGLNINCGCFGETSTAADSLKILENLFIIMAVFITYLYYSKNPVK
ncbi:MAG: hypothetical protein K9G57_00995 [Ignavibacteriales bacterium]|nr:hypothetical protein [Ignavibacteriales bacterium]